MIITKRLRIVPWKIEMAQDFFELTRDEGFALFPITDYRQPDLEAARNWIKKAKSKWAVLDKSESLLGMGGLTPWTLEGEEMVDITYRLRKSAWGKGLGIELAQGLIHYGFQELDLKEITATITPDNLPSKKLAEKLGMKFDRRIDLLNTPTDLYRLHR